MLVVCAWTMSHAQFTQGTKYVAASVSGLGINYSKASELNLGLSAEGGYYFTDAWSVQGRVGYDHAKTLDRLAIGAGVRYHFTQNGIFIGAGLEYGFDNYTRYTSSLLQTVTNDRTVYVDPATSAFVADPKVESYVETACVETKNHERWNNIRIPVEIGYTFYLNHFLALEPAIYSKMSLNHFSEGTEFGLKFGLGFYFDRLHNVQSSQRRQKATWD